MHIFLWKFCSSQKSCETCFMKFHSNKFIWRSIVWPANKTRCIFNYPQFGPFIFHARITSPLLLYRFYVKARISKWLRTEFMFFPLYVKKLLSNGESPTWNGMLVIFVSSNDVRPRWKFQPESHYLSFSLFPSLCTTVDVISRYVISCNQKYFRPKF